MDPTPIPREAPTPQVIDPSLPKTRWLIFLTCLPFTADLLSLIAISLFYVGLGGSLNEEVIGAIILTCAGLLVYRGPYLIGLLLSLLTYNRKRKANDYKALVFWQGILMALTLNEGVKLCLNLNPLHWQNITLYGAGALILGSALALNFYKYRSIAIHRRYVLTLLIAGVLLVLAQLPNINKWVQTEDDSAILEDLTANEVLEVVGEFDALETANLRVNTFEDQGYLYLTRYKSGGYDGGLEEAKTEEAAADSLEIYKMNLETGEVSKLDLGNLAQLEVFSITFADTSSYPLVLVTTREDAQSYVLILKDTTAVPVMEGLNPHTELIDAGSDLWMTNVTDSSHADLVIPSLYHFNPTTESFETGYEFESDLNFDSYSDVYGTPTAAQFEDKLVLISYRDIYQIDLNSNEINAVAESIYSPAFSSNQVFYSQKEDDHMNLYAYSPNIGESTLLLSIESKSPLEVLCNRGVDYALVKDPLEEGSNTIYQINAVGKLIKTNLGELGEFNFRNTWILKDQFISLMDDVFYLYRSSGDAWEQVTMDPKTSTFEVFPEKFSDMDKYGVFGIHFFEDSGRLYVTREESTVVAGKFPDKIYVLELNTKQLDFEKL